MRSITRDSLPHLACCACAAPVRAAATLWSRTSAAWWGVTLGANSRFWGNTAWRRLPGSTIRVGPRAEFRSARYSNQIGVNRGCLLSTLAPAASIVIGKDCGFTGVVIGAAVSIRLGDRVLCGANVTITDTDWHSLDAAERCRGVAGPAAPVSLEDDVWLGLNVTVLKGVTIGARTVVGAGSVVSRSLPADVIASGNPARPHRSLVPNTPLRAFATRARDFA